MVEPRSSTFALKFFNEFATLLHVFPTLPFGVFRKVKSLMHNEPRKTMTSTMNKRLSKLMIPILLSILYSAHLARAGEFRELAMCTSTNESAAFQRISIQADAKSPKRAVLILQASDGWTQVYSGPLRQTSSVLSFTEDTGIISAAFDKRTFKAKISFNKDIFECDERSFGN